MFDIHVTLAARIMDRPHPKLAPTSGEKLIQVFLSLILCSPDARWLTGCGATVGHSGHNSVFKYTRFGKRKLMLIAMLPHRVIYARARK